MNDLNNFVRIDDRLTTSGQPLADQFQALADEECRSVINLATPDSKGAIPNEGEIISSLGMTYIQIPVTWTAPTRADWDLFSGILKSDDRKTHVHCVVNMRASAFTFLYRTIHAVVDPAEAKLPMDEAWTPDGIWEEFIDEVLRDHNIDYYSI
tara:strand:+ start:608 stop:1066 length:459 start_codon:yes stop_codon:yes gene_type:complete